MLKIHCKRLADTIEPTQYHRNHHKHYWYFQPVHHTAYSSVPVLDCFTLGTVQCGSGLMLHQSKNTAVVTHPYSGVVWCGVLATNGTHIKKSEHDLILPLFSTWYFLYLPHTPLTNSQLPDTTKIYYYYNYRTNSNNHRKYNNTWQLLKYNVNNY